MRHLGLVLITAGFLGGSLIAVLDRESIDWTYFVLFLALSVIGVVAVQVALRREARDVTRTQANFEVLHTSLGAIVDDLTGLDADKEAIDIYDLPERLDHTFRANILAFADARESIAHSCGMRAYADVMSHFAAGERYLNRVWSCAADGYIDEAHEFVAHARDQFVEAQQQLRAATERTQESPASSSASGDVAHAEGA